MRIASSFNEYEPRLAEYVAKCENTTPRTIADIGKNNHNKQTIMEKSSMNCILMI